MSEQKEVRQVIMKCIDLYVKATCSISNAVTCMPGNVAVHKGLFLELPSGHVIVITVYTFLNVYNTAVRACCTCCICLSTTVSLGTH